MARKPGICSMSNVNSTRSTQLKGRQATNSCTSVDFICARVNERYHWLCLVDLYNYSTNFVRLTTFSITVKLFNAYKINQAA